MNFYNVEVIKVGCYFLPKKFAKNKKRKERTTGRKVLP